MTQKNIKDIDSKWYARRVLITGGAGFIGSHLAEMLVNTDCFVNVIDNLSTGSIKNIEHLMDRENFRFIMASDSDEIVMDRLISKSDVVFHLAAAVGVELIIKDPVRVIETNIQGAHSVLKIANRYRRKVIMVSTSEIYGKQNNPPFAEDSDRLLGPTTCSRWCYSTTKAIDEFLSLAYHKMYGLPVTIVRLFNTVGPRQSGQYGMVLPRFVKQAITGKKITVYGDGTQSRCFCNVSDVIKALDDLSLCKEADGQIFNIGSTEETSIKGLAERILELSGRSKDKDSLKFIPYEEAYEEGFEDMQKRSPEISKIKSCIGWEPKVKLDDIIKGMIEYEKSKL
ncbi:MAG: GDP-mannose 4,6-dehydratase [Bacteriovoracaceae bacterium]|nr:GDP-mannose 4,6-dehydratase [Bacteriovoracaceae bacterium]